MATDSRAIWIVTLSGVPKRLALGVVKYHAGAPAPADYHAVLESGETSGAGWDAVRTNWERPSPLAAEVGHASATPTLSDGVLTVEGVEYDINEYGDPHPDPQRNTRCCPDGKIVDNTALVVFIEVLGRDVEFIERGTKKVVRVHVAEPADAAATHPGRVDSGIYRQVDPDTIMRVDG